jgi:exodeoxyribonuclease V beta subunit
MGEAGARLSTTAIGRLLMRPPHARGFDDDAMPTIGDDPAGFAAAVERLDGLSAASGGTIGWAAEPSSALVRAPSARRALEEAPSPALTPAAWPAGRGAPRSLFRVTSYSGLVARAALFDRDEKITAMIEAEAPADGPFELEATDARAARADRSERREQGDPHDGDDEAPRAPVLSLGHGVEYGTWVHAVLEETEFTTAQAKDGRPLATLAAARAREVGLGDERAMIEELAAAMTPILRTPLDLRGAGVDDPLRIPDSFSLSRIAEGDRLDELAFDLRLGRATRGGDEPGEGRVRSAAIAHALATEGAPITEGARRWLRDERRRAERGESIVAGALGVLTGAIDLVFRIGRGDDARHYIVDYKTNRLGLGAVDDYRQSALDRAMIEHAYPLQSLLYTVALHRHLRVRLGGRYDYERHVGGLLYLFVRGMIGEQTPRDPHTGRSFGVLADRWPKALVLAFDAALDGASETRSGRWSGGARTPDSSATGATSATGAADAAERDGESER